MSKTVVKTFVMSNHHALDENVNEYLEVMEDYDIHSIDTQTFEYRGQIHFMKSVTMVIK